MANQYLSVIGGLVILSLVIVVIVLAALYGDDYNCDAAVGDAIAAANAAAAAASATAATTAKPGPNPPMKRFVNIKDTAGFTRLKDTAAVAYVKTIAYSHADGKSMQGGVIKLERGNNNLVFRHWFEGIVYLLDGEMSISTSYSGGLNPQPKMATIKVGQSMKIPRGMKMVYKSLSAVSYVYFVQQPPTLSLAGKITKAITRFDQTIDVQKVSSEISANMPLLDPTHDSLSYLEDLVVAGEGEAVEMIGGLYRLMKGPALDYTYEYEEFKLIVDGEFILTDGTGQKVSAQAGDLMYFPKHCAVHFTSPDRALGFYVGQRAKGTA